MHKKKQPAEQPQYKNIYKNDKNEKNVVVVKDNETTTMEKDNIPTREEIESYCQVAGYSIDIDDFISYNEVKGWKAKDWKAAVRRWKKNEARFEEKKKQEQNEESKSSKYDFDALQKQAFKNIGGGV